MINRSPESSDSVVFEAHGLTPWERCLADDQLKTSSITGIHGEGVDIVAREIEEHQAPFIRLYSNDAPRLLEAKKVIGRLPVVMQIRKSQGFRVPVFTDGPGISQERFTRWTLNESVRLNHSVPIALMT